jgi:hypothetical protein
MSVVPWPAGAFGFRPAASFPSLPGERVRAHNATSQPQTRDNACKRRKRVGFIHRRCGDVQGRRGGGDWHPNKLPV